MLEVVEFFEDKIEEVKQLIVLLLELYFFDFDVFLLGVRLQEKYLFVLVEEIEELDEDDEDFNDYFL